MRLIGIAVFLAAASRLGIARGADVFQGKELYTTHCAACHGASGQAVMPGAPNFARGERLVQPDAALYENIRSGKRAMPGFRGVLKNQDILDVIAYIRTLH